LKIKIKSLAAEAVIIRQEERRSRGSTRNSLHHHRTRIVRPEARASLLAYAYLRDRWPLIVVERQYSHSPDWANVKRIARKFSGTAIFDETKFNTWAGIEEQKSTIAA
jgi:hypothetical protein